MEGSGVMDNEQLSRRLQEVNQNPTNGDYWDFLAYSIRETVERADCVIVDKHWLDKVLLIASHANHHRVEGRCDPSWWPESVTLEDGDLDPVGEGE